MEGGEAAGGEGAPTGEEMEHGAAGVDGGGVEVGVREKEGGEGAAVAVTEDEGGAGVAKGLEMGGAGAGEGATQGEDLEEPVGPGDAVEVGGAAQRGSLGREKSKGRKRAGVVRARSAAARRVSGERR